jgi:prophage DNA circulation protein
MSWRDRLIEASFKNVPFKVKSHNYGAGRRVQTHNFANRDTPHTEDLGSEAEDFSIEAYIVQNNLNNFDYITERDNLIRVLRSEGAGILIHPYLGFKKVNVNGKFSMVETYDEGGIARFTIPLIESGKRALPEALTDFFIAVDNAVNQAMDMIGDTFYTAYSTTALFQDSSSNIIARAIGSVQSSLGLIAGIATEIISESVNNIALIRNEIDDSINSPVNIFNSLKNTCYSLASICGMSSVLLFEKSVKGYATDNGLAINDRAEDIYNNKITLDTTVTGGETGQYSGVVRGNIVELNPNNIDEVLGKSVVDNMINIILDFDYSGLGATPSNQEENVVLILDTFKFQMISTICRIAIRINFLEQEEAIKYIKLINNMIESVLLELGDEAVNGSSSIGIGNGTTQINNKDIFLSIQDIRKVFMDNMNQKISGITKGIDYRIPVDIETTLELAYNRYKDLNRSKEIYNNNRILIRHPGFMPPNDMIRILDE